MFPADHPRPIDALHYRPIKASAGPPGKPTARLMNSIKPYIKTAVTILVILAVYKMFLQPLVAKNDTLAKYLPAV